MGILDFSGVASQHNIPKENDHTELSFRKGRGAPWIPAHSTPLPFTEEEPDQNLLTADFSAAMQLASDLALGSIQELDRVRHTTRVDPRDVWDLQASH